MTEREIAKRLRGVAKAPTLNIEGRRELTLIADELDPPRPEPGTVVWWRDAEGLGEWSLGQIHNTRKVEFFGAWKELDLEAVQIKPARIAKPMQEIVDIPPVSEWPEYALTYYAAFMDAGEAIDPVIILTREEAGRREAER